MAGKKYKSKRKLAVENGDWELYKEAWGNYDNLDDYDKDFVRLMFDTDKLEHEGANPHEVFMAQMSGLVGLCVKYNIDTSKVFKELSERYNRNSLFETAHP